MARKRDTAAQIRGKRREAGGGPGPGRPRGAGGAAARRDGADRLPRAAGRPAACEGIRRSGARRGSGRTPGASGWSPTRPWTPPACRPCPRETSAPGAPAAGGHARATRRARLGAAGLSGARPAAQHAAAPGPGGRGCTDLDRPAQHAGAAVRALRVPSHHGPAARGGLARDPQAGGAPLAPGGPPGAPQAPAPAAPRGDRRLLHGGAAPRGPTTSGPTPASANGRTAGGHCGCAPAWTRTRGCAAASLARAACGPTTSGRASRRASCGTARPAPCARTPAPSSRRQRCGPGSAGWAATTRCIEPGSPWENGAGAACSGTRRDAGRTPEIFTTRTEAQVLSARWAIGRPHPTPWAVRRGPLLTSRVAQRSGAGHPPSPTRAIR